MSQKIKGMIKSHIGQKHTRWGRKGVVRVIIPHKVEIKAESTKQTKNSLFSTLIRYNLQLRQKNEIK